MSDAEPKRYRVSDWECEQIEQPLLSCVDCVNHESWNGFPPRGVRISSMHGARQQNGNWRVSMMIEADPGSVLPPGVRAVFPYPKADFSRLIPADAVLTEV